MYSASYDFVESQRIGQFCSSLLGTVQERNYEQSFGFWALWCTINNNTTARICLSDITTAIIRIEDRIDVFNLAQACSKSSNLAYSCGLSYFRQVDRFRACLVN